MHGMSKAQVDEVERAALGAGPKRPRDAATLILLDRDRGSVRVLMGRRHMRHAFMPGKFVFPGGRTDPADSRIPVASPLTPEDEAKLTARAGRVGAARHRSFGNSRDL
jgi:8-oxo-dGTP pyrophosphatase MutT (NUDIX family)